MIFYFTATGNSKFIADRISAATGEQSVDITACVQQSRYSFNVADGERIGFVVPVYYYGIPIIVSEFLSKLKISAEHDYYSYAILNCGGTTGDSGRFIKRFFNINAVFGIETVDNYVPMFKTVSESEINERLDKAEREIDVIVESINDKKVGTFNTVSGRLPRFMTSIAYPMYKHGRKTNKFKVSNLCNGCGLCEKICPRGIINSTGGKPIWKEPQCEICLACLHRCPVSAIEYGKSSGRGRYVNPRVEF